MTDPKAPVGVDLPAGAQSTYPELLTKAARTPELLSLADHARLLDVDRAHLVGSLRRHIAAVDAELAGLDVHPRTVSDRRADDLVRLARRGDLRVTSLQNDEQDAINNTPGLWDRLWNAWGS